MQIVESTEYLITRILTYYERRKKCKHTYRGVRVYVTVFMWLWYVDGSLHVDCRYCYELMSNNRDASYIYRSKE